MGLWDLVSDGTDRLALAPTGLEERYRALVAASRSRLSSDHPRPGAAAGRHTERDCDAGATRASNRLG
jgi:hypothetical protein